MSIPFIIGVLAEQAGAAVSPPVPASGFATGPDYRTNWVGYTTATSQISQQGNAVRLQAGPTLANLDAEHCQIVSKLKPPSQMELIVDITVRDNLVGTSQIEAGLIYMAMSGDTAGGFPSDLNSWPGVDGSTRFEMNCFGYRCSFNGRDPSNQNNDQIRLRQANATGGLDLVQIIGGGAPNTQPGSFPFITGKTYRCTFTKQLQSFMFEYQNITDAGQPVKSLPTVSSDLIDDYNVGQLIFRVMAGRIIDFNIVAVNDLDSGVSPPPSPPPPVDTGELPPETASKVAHVTSASALQAVLANSDSGKLDGWTIYCDPPAGTTWGDTFNATKKVDPTKQPCVIRTNNPGDVTLTGQVNFDPTSSGLILWGFKRRGAGAFTNLRGKRNSIRRSDFSGYGHPHCITTSQGDACEIWYCSFHDPLDWTTAERNAYAAGGSNYLRIAIRSAKITVAADMLTAAHIYACNFYNYPTKLNPTDYSSSQDDASEPNQSVDYMAGTDPPLLLNWLFEKILVEATHLQGLDANGALSKGAATLDNKAGGVTYKKITMLCPGRFDNRGNGNNVFEDIYTQRAMLFNGGANGVVTGGKGNRVTRVYLVNGPWGAASLQVQTGSYGPNANASGGYQVANDMIIEDIWGDSGAAVKVGVDGGGGTSQKPNGTTVRRTTGVNVTAIAGMQTNTTITAGTPQGAKPTKLSRSECGVTATFVDPQY